MHSYFFTYNIIICTYTSYAQKYGIQTHPDGKNNYVMEVWKGEIPSDMLILK